MSRPVRLSRRELLVAGGTMAASAAFVPNAWGRLVERPVAVGPGTFLDGVASGEPAPDGITLWSRLTTDRPVSGAQVVVCKDAGLTQTVATVVVPTTASIDHSLKVRITGLQPSTHYFYKWTSSDGSSDTGRTKTAPPANSDQPLRIDFCSCSLYPAGFFNAYRDMTKTDDVDLVLFLGDYIYEYAPGDYDSNHVRDTSAPAVDLASYRTKYKLYRSDPALRELHRLHPMDAIWDDHEVADNYTDDNPRPSDMQRTAGYRTNFEWLPRMTMRDDRFRLYKTVPLGTMADLFLIDQRQYRTGQGMNNGGNGKTMLGAAQLAWFQQQLQASKARWKLIANEVQFAPFLSPTDMTPVSDDAWDEFATERQTILDTITKVNAADTTYGGNVLFLTGDIHTFEANEVRATGGRSGAVIASEFIGGSISSPGVSDPNGAAEAGIKAANPWIKQFNGTQHGYGTLDLTAQSASIGYRVSDITKQDAASTTMTRWEQPVKANAFAAGSTNTKIKQDADAPARPTSFPVEAAATKELAARRRNFDRDYKAEMSRRLEGAPRARRHRD